MMSIPQWRALPPCCGSFCCEPISWPGCRVIYQPLCSFSPSPSRALAYGRLAGLHGINGLYASLIALVVYALFGTSRHLIIGAEAPLAILVASSITGVVAGGDPARFAMLVAVEAIMVGGILLAAGVIRIGFIADFIPKSVVIGFLNGMALIIIMAQAGAIAGIEITGRRFLSAVVGIVDEGP